MSPCDLTASEMARRLRAGDLSAREVMQAHFGVAMLKPDPEKYLQEDFAAIAETMALAAGMTLESENVQVSTGLEN